MLKTSKTRIALLRSTLESIATPCSVKTMGLYLKPILSPLEVTNCDFQFLNPVSVNSNIKSLGSLQHLSLSLQHSALSFQHCFMFLICGNLPARWNVYPTKCLPREMFILWNVKPISLGRSLFHRGEAYFSGAQSADSIHLSALNSISLQPWAFTFQL